MCTTKKNWSIDLIHMAPLELVTPYPHMSEFQPIVCRIEVQRNELKQKEYSLPKIKKL